MHSSRSFNSIHLRILLSPREVYSSLRDPSEGSRWIALRRPLFITFFIASCATFISRGEVTVGSILLAMITWFWVLLVQWGALWVAFACGRVRLTSRLTDLYFLSYSPWLLLLLGWSVLTTILSMHFNFVLFWKWLSLAPVAAMVCLYLDWQFFRVAVGGTEEEASRMLAIQRAISWPILLVIYSYGSLWQTLAERFPK
jgi:hypothetical protein